MSNRTPEEQAIVDKAARERNELWSMQLAMRGDVEGFRIVIGAYEIESEEAKAILAKMTEWGKEREKILRLIAKELRKQKAIIDEHSLNKDSLETVFKL